MVVDFDDFDANHRFLGFVSALTHLPTGRHRTICRPNNARPRLAADHAEVKSRTSSAAVTCRAQLCHQFPVSIVTVGHGFNITLASYLDRFDFGFIVDRELVPDVWDLADTYIAEIGRLSDASGAEWAHLCNPRPRAAAQSSLPRRPPRQRRRRGPRRTVLVPNGRNQFAR